MVHDDTCFLFSCVSFWMRYIILIPNTWKQKQNVLQHRLWESWERFSVLKRNSHFDSFYDTIRSIYLIICSFEAIFFLFGDSETPADVYYVSSNEACGRSHLSCLSSSSWMLLCESLPKAHLFLIVIKLKYSALVVDIGCEMHQTHFIHA